MFAFPRCFHCVSSAALCPRVLKPYGGHREDVVGAVPALADLLALEGMRVAAVNSMIL